MNRSSWVRFVSRRWFAARKESGGSASSLFAAAGIAVGVAALIVVLGVMNGFQMGFVDSILEIASFHVRIDDERTGPPDETLLARLTADSAVRSVLPFAETRCLIVAADGRAQPLALRAVPADTDRRDPTLLPALSLEAPLFPPDSASADLPGIVLGTELARYLNLSPGDEAELLVVSAGKEEGAEARSIPVRVTRTFRSGFYDYDFGLAFMSRERAAVVFPADRPTPYVYGIKLKERYDDGAFAARLAAVYGLGPDRVETWREYNRAFFGALRTEKTVMMLLVGLIFLIVGVNIYHSMRRAVAERMEDIAVLRAVGATSESLRRTFVLDGLAVGAGGALIGLLFGLLIAINVNQVFSIAEAIVNGATGFASRLFGSVGAGDFRVFSPQYFYLMEVPVRVLFPETLFVVAAAVASAAAAAGAAAAQVSRMAPAEVLRYE